MTTKKSIADAVEDSSIDQTRASMFSTLNSLNVNDKTEKKDNLTYLSWSYAWSTFKKYYPSATYRIARDPSTGLPYFSDQTGIMVFTEVTAGGQTYEMWLPVMDSKNKAMKFEPYTYYIYDSYKKQQVEKTVNAATMFDINKTIMRCFVKNLSMFGLGLYLYAGQDLPEEAEGDNAETQDREDGVKVKPLKKIIQPASDRFMKIRAAINGISDTNSLRELYTQHKNEVDGNSEIRNLFIEKKNQLLSFKPQTA